MEILPLRLHYLRLLCLFLLAPTLCSAQFAEHIDTAYTYLGVTEVGSDNHGPEIRDFLEVTGLPEGYAWCAAFVSYCLDVSGARRPVIRTARAQGFITNKSVKASSVLMGIKQAEPGMIVVWKKGNGRFGHAGFYARPCDCHEEITDKNCFVTIEGNTSNGDGSVDSERNGDGVYERVRSIELGNYFRIVSFTGVIYE